MYSRNRHHSASHVTSIEFLNPIKGVLNPPRQNSVRFVSASAASEKFLRVSKHNLRHVRGEIMTFETDTGVRTLLKPAPKRTSW